MKGRYSVKSDNNEKTHAFTKSDKGNDLYIFENDGGWTKKSTSYTEINGKVAFIDADGGPMISPGWSNNEIEVIELTLDEKKNVMAKLREKL